MAANLSANSIRDKLLTLATVNVLQPVRKQSLSDKLGEYMSQKQLGSTLKELIQEDFVAKDKGYYRTTYKGNKLTIPNNARKLRDIQRMWHLLLISKQRGGD